MKKRVLFDEMMIARTITRISHEILEQNDVADVVLVGIKTRGIYLAERLQQRIEVIAKVKVPVEHLDIQFYRDDLARHSIDPVAKTPQFNYDLNKKVVIIVDDVLYTGRTVRAAIDAIMDVSRPDVIKLAILVDRGHRELPIRADYIGKNIPTSRKENVKVCLKEVDETESILITE